MLLEFSCHALDLSGCQGICGRAPANRCRGCTYNVRHLLSSYRCPLNLGVIMAQQYLLPCACGRANTVSVAQAGRTLTCSCGQDYRVPSLAGLRRLESAEAA